MKQFLAVTALAFACAFGQTVAKAAESVAVIAQPSGERAPMLLIWIPTDRLSNVSSIVLTIEGEDGTRETRHETKPAILGTDWRIAIFLPDGYAVRSVQFAPVPKVLVDVPVKR